MNQSKTPIASLDHLVNGALAERMDHALKEVVLNIGDLNTSATKPRKITIDFTFHPDDSRENVGTDIAIKCKLQPRRPITTEFLIGIDYDTGEVLAREITKQIPGQMDIDGRETTPRLAPITNIK